MTELESAIRELVPTKIARTKYRMPWITHKLKKQLRKQKLLAKQRGKGSSKFSSVCQQSLQRKKIIYRYPYTLHGQILAEETNTNI